MHSIPLRVGLDCFLGGTSTVQAFKLSRDDTAGRSTAGPSEELADWDMSGLMELLDSRLGASAHAASGFGATTFNPQREVSYFIFDKHQHSSFLPIT